MKCNVSASCDGDTMISGASWINRDSQSHVVSHSRRSYSGVKSFLEAELLAMFWAVESVKNLRLNHALNRVASEVATSVTRDPVWLSSLIN